MNINMGSRDRVSVLKQPTFQQRKCAIELPSIHGTSSCDDDARKSAMCSLLFSFVAFFRPSSWTLHPSSLRHAHMNAV
jgi:hypothetical protein